MYDAALGRWHAVDPMSEKYYSISSYVYGLNTPHNCIDPDGQKIILGLDLLEEVALIGEE